MSSLSFSAPLILLALAALPLLWFLLRATPPKPQRVRFPAFEILRRARRTEETPDRTPWPILLLRLAIAALTILGIAGPILNAPTSAPRNGPLVLVVDNSWAAAPRWRGFRDSMMTAAEEAARSDKPSFVLATAAPDDAALSPLSAEELRDAVAKLDPEPLRPDYERARERLKASGDALVGADIRWLSDGLAHEGAEDLLAFLKSRGDVTVLRDDAAPVAALRPATRDAGKEVFPVAAIGGSFKGALVARARDGRELSRTPVDMNDSEAFVSLDLPLALRNEVAEVRLDGLSSAGAVQLMDARDRRARVGLIAGADQAGDPLLAGEHYVSKALEPFAMFTTDSLENLMKSDATAIVMDDIGVLRANDAESLKAWIEKGGVLIRFAGPALAEAADDAAPALTPVALRGGGRALGGALTWETPQRLAQLSADGPFAGMAPPADIFVRRQVLAEPGGETSARTWASLADGTPLVTGVELGSGAIALFHVTATPEWSDLPLSSTFIEMLRRLVFLSTLSAKGDVDDNARLRPFRTLDGFGVLRSPGRDIAGSTIVELDSGPAPARPPGLYGSPDAPIAVNAVGKDDALLPARFEGVAVSGLAANPPVRLAAPLLAAAAMLLILDGLIALFIAGRLRLAALVLAVFAPIVAPPADAQPLNAPIEQATIEAALATRLAYVRTGDPATDRVAEAGLRSLSRELARRTSLEPAAPMAVDLETDDLTVFPFLYWPLTAGAEAPSDGALANVETFLRFGGLVLFDTRDDERAIAGADTQERIALKAILRNLNLPALRPAPPDHVLTRSFYLLPDLPGRFSGNPVWVQAGDGPNDSVTPVIIGGRDWAGAWAADDLGRPLMPIADGGNRAREMSYRAGVNIVMVALTGNYKSDQVHTPILLERLGRK
jgi:hypothetical protein